MNNKKYSIGFVIVGLVLLLLISGAYQFSYQAALERAEEEKYTEIEDSKDSVATEGEATRNGCYYLFEKNGYVVVFLDDKETVYEYTSIEVDDLPEEVKSEIKNGKYIPNIEELYGFLENYSS